MADFCDDAQSAEARFLEEALERAAAGLNARGRGYVFVDGLARCRECDDPVPMARVRAAPNSGLCAACQSEKDGRRGVS